MIAQKPTPTHMRFSVWLPVVVLFCGAALRLAFHDIHGLEGDDAFSLALSRLPTADLIRGLFRLELDVHPPLHFLLVKAWAALAGESLLALRLLNILLDMLTGALLLRVAGRSWVLGLWAVSPLLVFGGWLVRMYTLLGLLAVGAAACVALAERHFWRGVLGAAALSLLALYTHVTGVIVLAAAGAGLLWTARSSARRLAGVAALGGLVIALYAPFAVPVVRLYTSGAALGAAVNPANSVPAVRVPFEAAAVALGYRAGWPAWVVAAGALTIIVLGVWAARPYARPTAALALTAGVMIVGVVVVGVGAGLYKPRYIVPFAPFVMLWVAWGLAGLRSRGRLIYALLGAAGLAAAALMGLRGIAAYGWRDDWTAATDYVTAHTAPGDVVVVVPDWGQEAFRYHSDDDTARGFFPRITPALDLDAAFGPYVADAPRVWLVRYQPEVSDPDGLAAAYFEDRCPTVTQAFPAGMTLALYACQPAYETLPAGATPIDVRFGDALALRGVQVAGRPVSAGDTRLYDGSGRVLVALYWEALTPGANGAAPRVQLTAPSGAVYGVPLAAEAGPPPTTWEPGTVFAVYTDLLVNPQTPPGLYNIEVTAANANGERLAASGPGAGAAWFIAGTVEVVR